VACPEASVGWGVPLTDAPVGWSLHPSVRPLAEADSPLLDTEPQGAEDYWQHLEVVPTGYQGHARSAFAVYVRRSLTSTADSAGDVNPLWIAGPTDAERACLARYLDEIGFAGDRQVRLLLTAREV
jgi:hypothetical protein